MPLSQIRMAAPAAPRHLVTAHLAAIIQGAVHLSLTTAIAFSGLPEWLETAAALLLVAGSALFVAGAMTNWLQHITGDHFAERTLGWKLFAASSAGHVPGATRMSPMSCAGNRSGPRATRVVGG